MRCANETQVTFREGDRFVRQLNSNWAVIARRTIIAACLLSQIALCQTQPQTTSITPSSGSGLAASFTAAFSDPSGGSQIGGSTVYISSQLGAGISCIVSYSFGAFYLTNDAGNGLLGPVYPGSSTSVSNSSCSISGIGASAAVSGANLSWTIPLTFTSSFAGAKNIYLYAGNNSGLNSGWVQKGTWTVVGSP